MKRNKFLLAAFAIFGTSALFAQEVKEEEEQTNLNEVVLIGGRNSERTVVNSSVPVDIIDIEKLKTSSPQLSVNDILNYVIPSFNSVRQSASDGTEHIDPVTLRGMGPDQVLVLVNGKRRHTTSLVNYQNTVGNGSVGTDLSAIPISAIDKIEVLRDGAAAQYGSDAIAGVVNIVLKSKPGGDASLTYGQTSRNDGETYNFNGSYGTKLGDKGSIVFSAVISDRKKTNRSKDHGLDIFGDNFAYDFADDPAAARAADDAKIAALGLSRKDFRFQIGDAAIKNQQFFVNAETALTDKLDFYSFGGVSLRQGNGYGFRRLPSDLSGEALQVYPNGFQATLKSNVNDFSNSTGLRYAYDGWNIDLSNTLGLNTFKYNVENSINQSLGFSSPTDFYAGRHQFLQNTVNLDFSKKINQNISLAFGGEYRYEQYKIGAGDEASYTGSGSESFRGFAPTNSINGDRNSFAAYVDGELKFGNFSADVAGRFENYSDFGNTINGKLALRYEYIKGYSIRGAISTGFRAPSLQQKYFSNSYTDFYLDENGNQVLGTKGIIRNESDLSRELGLDQLKQEKSINASLGLTFRPTSKLFITIDGYFIRVNDRIVLTSDIYDPALEQYNITAARIFTNAIDTETKGLDVVISYDTRLGKGKLNASLSGNLNETKIVDYHFPASLTIEREQFFGPDQVNIIESLSPKTKATLALNYSISGFNFMVRNTYFGKVIRDGHPYGSIQEHTGKVVTDASIGYDITKNFNFTIGANNLLDVFPDKQVAENSYYGVFPYAPVQMGMTGAYYFARASFKF
ncbi:iron complex outermembrane recepter protein [Chishuiella changwenlii]|uniref:Iron complex outermembrane recepter protein n=1 Tax=Chishuiella changwenlii TaxID=1434701 RepID=A0A1M6Z411_9FLAO|nr:TonB-dependent receptor [Chishuiella changwenlii]GGE87257.1 ligand-gated channel [Chishuiella changwenlii]SHL25140.1 iron complex outermembrane recepter protein [Chishuiella changwenlii]